MRTRRDFSASPSSEKHAPQRGVGPTATRDSLGPRRARERLTVTIDARCLTNTMTGTQRHVLELISAMHRDASVHLRVLVGADISSSFRDGLTRHEGLEVLDAEAVGVHAQRSLVVHRPYQLFDSRDLPLLLLLGERLVITMQDLIAYRNPRYSRSAADWDDLRQLTRVATALADHVVFFSHHVQRDAAAEGLPRADSSVVRLGVDHENSGVAPRPFEALSSEAEGPFLLCLGNDFDHKNRVFALELFSELRTRWGWDGRLVLAGPHVRYGSSAEAERSWLQEQFDVARFVTDLGVVTEAEKILLLTKAAAVLYPTVEEGFGLIPFEAAAAGTPCLFAWQTALAEILPEEFATISPGNVAASAALTIRLLSDPSLAESNVKAIRTASRGLTWERTAAELLDLYEQVIQAPPSPLRTVIEGKVDPGAAVRALARADRADDVPEDVYRAYRALEARPSLRKLVFVLVSGIYRLGRAAAELRRSRQS
jgi:glycosyltransferase involved in cell wall biosynthesis